MAFFEYELTLEELKKSYRFFTLKCHPDKFDANSLMAEINADYEKAAFEIKLGKRKQPQSCSDFDGVSYKDNIIRVIKRLNALGIDAAFNKGQILALGDTYSHKEELKHMGFRWYPTFKIWYWDIGGAPFNSLGYNSLSRFCLETNLKIYKYKRRSPA